MKRIVILLWFLLIAGSAIAMVADESKFYDQDGDKIFENLAARMETAPGRIPVLITYRETQLLTAANAVRLDNRIPLAAVRRTYENLPVVAASLTKAEIEMIRTDPMVGQIEYDAPVRAVMNGARSSFGVQAVSVQFKLTGNTDGSPTKYTSGDVVIAILDTGIDTTHPDLQGKVIYWRDFVNGRATPYDDEGHGTHVAGVAAGAGRANHSLAGVAPGAALVGYKVLDNNGEGTMSDVIAAVNDAITNRIRYNIRIMNLSLASSGSSNGRDALSQACNRAVANHIVVVVAAGNDGPDTRTIGTPSAAAAVITVGAGADSGVGANGFYLANFSSRGPTADGRVKPDLWAPGVNILSPKKGGGYSQVSGTSFATPFVAGTVALMISGNHALLPPRIKYLLMNKAQRWAPGGKNNEAGYGRLQVYQTVAAAIGKPATTPPVTPTVTYSQTFLTPGTTLTFPLNVTTTNFAIAVTAIIQSSTDVSTLTLSLTGPDGSLMAQRTSSDRQVMFSRRISTPGSYTLQVINGYYTAPVLIDISGGLAP